MRIKEANRIPFQALFLLMVFASIMLDTRFTLPFGTLIRWVLPAVLLLAVLIAKNGKVYLSNNLLYWLLIAVFGITAILSPQKNYSMQRWISFILITLTFINYFSLLGSRGLIYKGMSAFGFLYLTYGVLNFLFLQWGQERPTGLTANANSLGHFSNLSFLVALLYHRKAQSKGKKRWMLVAMVASAICVILSASRSALIVLLLNVVLAVWLMGTKKFRIVVCVIAPVILLLLLNENVLEKIPGIGRLLAKDGIGEDRELMWDHGMGLVKQRPWLGWGYGISISLNIIENASFHNSYLTVAIESGIIGATILVLLVLSVLIRGFVSYRNNRRVETLIVFMLACNKVIDFIGESSMTSVGSAEGFFFWGILMWLLVESVGGESNVSDSGSVMC